METQRSTADTANVLVAWLTHRHTASMAIRRVAATSVVAITCPHPVRCSTLQAAVDHWPHTLSNSWQTALDTECAQPAIMHSTS